ncbi:MAG TPA: PKD domain-containing protein, partial [Thermoplasmata archaeon]|nr:PKD domain-containing protein [Thermoplasmata archaeon]
PTPGHVYGTPGTFGVSVRVVDAVGAVVTGTLNGTIDTFARLVVSPPTPAGTLEVGHAVVYAVNVSGGAPPFAYAWTLGDGSNATGANPSHEYATAGRYTVLVVVSDSRGQVDDGVATIVIAGNGSPSNGALFGDLEAVGLVAAGFAAGVAAYVLFARRKGGRPALRSGPSERDSGPA